MRNSMNSNVCMLYDKMALIHLVKTRAASRAGIRHLCEHFTPKTFYL
ncbi:T3SS effector NleG family protein [Vibrio cholerae]